MKTALVTLNSKYVQSSLALRSIRTYAKRAGVETFVKEYTINSLSDDVVAALAELDADVYGFSCYVFNIEKTMTVVRMLKKVRPDCFVFLGGPETSFECEDFLRKNREVDCLVRGEGEQTDTELLQALENGNAIENIAGLSYIYNGTYTETENRAPICPLDEVPFAYTDEELEELKNKLIYYESSRGCPFGCTYCMSALDRSVRSLSEERIYGDLLKFIEHRVKQVKFVDRTFNYDSARALKIMRFLAEHDNGVTGFHFEIAADLLDEESLSFFKTVRKGLFQLEIGVQSTNPETLKAICRNVPFERIRDKIAAVAQTNCTVHVDLIAGLPYEGFELFKESFNDVYALHADALALGFLKVLKGAPIFYEKEYGMVCKDEPPYEVLYNRYISYEEMRHLKRVEALLELYDNSGLCKTAVRGLIKKSGLTPFEFYERFAEYLLPKGFFDVSNAVTKLFDYLFEFGVSICEDKCFVENLLAYDLYGLDKLSSKEKWLTSVVPDRELQHFWMRNPETLLSKLVDEDKKRVLTIPNDKWIRNTEVVSFAYTKDGCPQDVVMLFLYGPERGKGPIKVT